MKLSSKRIRTHDFDKFLAWEHAIGIESQQTQLSRGRCRLSAAFATLGNLILWRHQSSERTLCEYSIPDGMVELCICRHPTQSLWCDREFSGTTVVVHCDRQQYRSIIPSKGLTYGCLLTVESALQYGLISEQQYSRAVSRELAVATAHDSLVDALLDHVDPLFEQPAPFGMTNESVNALDAILSAWQRIIDECLAPDRAETTQEIGKGQTLVESVFDFVACRPAEVFTVSQIAAELDVARRTVERGFRHIVGVSPYQYLLIRRLHRARRMLKYEQASVLSACSQSGFENTSRFAMLYARQFGESPSQTKNHRRGATDDRPF